MSKNEYQQIVKANDLEYRKQEYADQYLGRAELIRDLEDYLRVHDPEHPDELYKMVEARSGALELTTEQKDDFFKSVEIFWQKHLNVKKYLKLYPKPEDLFEACFGIPPFKNLSILVGPISIHFIVKHRNEIGRALSHRVNSPQNIKYEYIYEEIAGEIEGVAFAEVRIPDLQSQISIGLEDVPEVVVHEEQHIFNKLFIPKPDKYEPSLEIYISEMSELEYAKNQQIKHMAKFLRSRISCMDDSTWDEILALFKDGQELTKIQEFISGTYFRRFLNIAINSNSLEYAFELIKNQLKRITVHQGTEQFPLPFTLEEIEFAIRDSYNQGFQDDIKVWVEALATLEQKGYSREEIISILRQELPQKWPKIAKRLPEIN